MFQRCEGYAALDPEWRQIKDEITDWLAKSIPDGARVLSVGCELGYMEQRLWREQGDRIDLHVQDYASEALRWLRQVMPADHIHDAHEDGLAGQTQDGKYNLIYLSGVDYALPDEELIALLSGIRACLRDGGQILILSGSFLEESAAKSFVRSGKEAAKWLLEQFGLYKRGQFWGWMRSRTEYQAIMCEAGMNPVVDGFFETPHWRGYWIKGDGASPA